MINDIGYNRWLKSKFKDFRKKAALQWFNDNYFVSVYDSLDNCVATFEDIESLSRAFNIPVKELLRKIRQDDCIVLNHKKYKICLDKKEPINENYKRRK